jgi:sugar lactone lactonase YvrE
MLKLLDIIETRNILGEGPHWNSTDETLWWTDIHARRLFRLDPATRRIETIDMPERVGCLTFCEGAENCLLAAFESGLGFYRFADGRIDWLVRPEAGASGRRFNDGRVDRQGRFWVSTMVEDSTLAAPGSAGLFCLDLDGGFTQRVAGVEIGNGICFSPDGGTLYFADSPRQVIHAYDLHTPSGSISGRRLFARVTEGVPDGAAVDEDGFVWSARWGAGCVVRHAPDGSVAETVTVPVAQPTCVAFGGPGLRLMFVTSARDGLDGATARDGALLIYESPVAGLPDPRYSGKRVLF